MTRDSSFVVRRWSFVYLLGALLLSGVWGFSDRRSTIDPGPPVDSRAGAGNRRTVTEVGVLVIAHGGSSRWDSMVRKAVRAAELPGPSGIAFGMGMHEHEVRGLQQVVDRLERRAIDRIVVIPLLVSSHSEVFRQYEYLFGLRKVPEWAQAGKPLDLEVPVVMGQPLDDSRVVAEILLERARRLSRSPEEEAVILVAHGPISDDDNQQWLSTMEGLGEYVKREGGFYAALGVTMRDDAPEPIQEQAVQQFRRVVQVHSQQRRVLVVPLLIAQGGIERKIPKHLAGLSYAYSGDTLLPHPKLTQWIADEAQKLGQAGVSLGQRRAVSTDQAEQPVAQMPHF